MWWRAIGTHGPHPRRPRNNDFFSDHIDILDINHAF